MEDRGSDALTSARRGSDGAFAPLACALVAGACTFAAFTPTTRSIIELWSTSDTFAHGWFVLPLCLWLGWRVRARLVLSSDYRPDWRMLLPLIACGALWLTGRTAGVQVAEQLALVTLAMSVVALVLGRELARVLRFPLLMLVFLAPVGAELVPVLMEVTADFTVAAIRLVGIPVYREGLYFSIPSGNWSVVEACSGIRYLIASLMLGTLYSGLYLHGAWSRSAFIVLSLVVPIVANGIRAFGIVMLGHFSDMRLATGADHLIYGWVFFGIVMFCLFAIGARFPSGPEPAAGEAGADASSGAGTRARPGSTTLRPAVLGAVAAALVAGAFPVWARVMDGVSSGASVDANTAFLPFEARAIEPDEAARSQGGWAPVFIGADDVRVGVLGSAGGTSAPVIARAYVYAEQRQGKELIGYANTLLPTDDERWRVARTETLDVAALAGTDTSGGTDTPLRVASTTLDGPDGRLLVWRWNAVRGHHTSSAVPGKLHELVARLSLDPRPSVGYVLSVEAGTPGAQEALRAAALEIAALPQLDP